MGVDHSPDLKTAFSSERLIFRALEDNDGDKKFVFDMNNDALVQTMSNLTVLKPKSAAGFQKFMDFAQGCPIMAIACLPPFVRDDDGADTETRMSPPDVVSQEDKARATPIGFVSIMAARGNTETTGHHRCGQLGISILRPFTGKGYGGEMINWVLDWSFRRANLHRVELGTWSVNHNAIKLYRSLGFVEEGRDREALMLDRKWVDLVRFSMLEHEWEKLRRISS